MAGPWEDYAPPEPKAGPWSDYAPEKPFLEKLGSFARKVYENPPPTIAGARDIIKAAPQAATELTWGADPQAAEQAAGTIAGAAGMGLGFRGLGGEGVLGRPMSAEARAAPLIPPRAVVPPAAADPAVEAAARLGVEVPRYLATDSTAVPQVAASIKNVPFAGQPIVRSAERLSEQLGQAKSGIAGIGGTPESAGERAKSGLTSFIQTGSKKPVSAAYEAVDALIDPEVRVPLDNTRDMIGQIMAERTRARIPGQSKAVQTVFDAVQDPRGMDYAGTKGLRSFLGEKSPLELASQGLAPTEVKRIYGALTKDLGAVVRDAGGDEAFTAWHRANRLASLTKAQQNALTKITGTTGDAASEAVFNRLVTFANSKAGGDLKRLQLARKAMGPDAWEAVGSALIDRLGMAPDGTFSPGRFVTAFGNMAPAGRSQVFSPSQHAALMDLFTVSKHVQDRITRFANPSGTARGVFGNMVAGGSLFVHPVHAIVGLVGARLAAEALSRPAVVRAATQAARASLSGNPVARARALNALQAVAAREGLVSASSQPPAANAPQYAGPQLPFRPGEQMDNLMASVNGPQGYPDFHWVNPAGVDAFLASGPMSTNIEDRRPDFGGRPTPPASFLQRMLAPVPRRAEGGRVSEDAPYLVGEQGPELYVPDRPGTVLPADDPWARAAARTGRRGRTEGAGTQFVEGGYGIPSLYGMLNEGAQKAFESAGSLQRGGSYDPGPVLQQALGAAGAPLVAPAMEGAVLGAGAIRRAAIPQVSKQALFDYSRLRDVPDVPQVNLERYQPRDVPARTQALADEANVARVNEVVKRGAEQGGIEWYNTEPLRQAFINELGPAKGMPAYQQYLDLVASTSPRSNVGTNVRNAAYYYGLAQRGEPLPQVIAKGGALSVAEPLPAPYGHIAQGLHAQNAKNVLEEGGWPVLQNPKPASFAQNLAGNQMPVTVDTHNARLWGMTDTKGRPIDKPAKTEYDFMERLQQAEAAKMGMTPAQYQASAWIGGGEQTGLKSSADPFLKVVEDRIRLTAQKTGETPQQVLARFIRGGNIPGGAGPLLGVGGVAGADALSRRD